MGDRTAIEWTEATWNPTRGCTRASEGCRNCYAETIAGRFSDAGAPYHGYAERGRPGSKWTGRVEVQWANIDQPLRWRRPRRIFAGSMSDLFHEALKAEEIATIFAIMVAAVHLRGHLLQVLTKRSDRMREILGSEAFWEQVNAEAGMHVLNNTDPLHRRTDDARATLEDYGPDHPPPGIWLGTSVENQAAADRRIPALRATPAARRFLSCEPLLEPIRPDLTGIDWVICGGESGAGARPMHPDWARRLRDRCADAGVAFFFKQWGEWREFFNGQLDVELDADSDPARALVASAVKPGWVTPDGMFCPTPGHLPLGVPGRMMERVGKHAAGRLLDGVLHDAVPA